MADEPEWEKIPGGLERRIIEPVTFSEQINTLDQALTTLQREQMLAFMRRHDVEQFYLAIVQPSDEGSEEERDMKAVANGIAIHMTVETGAWSEFHEILGPLSEIFDVAIDLVKEQFKEMM